MRMVTQYCVGELGHLGYVYVTRRDYEEDSWSIDNAGCQFNTFQEFEIPPMHSSDQRAEFLKRARYTGEEALQIAEDIIAHPERVQR